MKCYICENETKSSVTDNVVICAECAKKAGNSYLMKCESCGSAGFLKRTPLNKERLETKMGISIDDFAPIIVITCNGCPGCKGGGNA